MLPTYTPPFIADRVVGSFVAVCGMCLGMLSALLMGGIQQERTAFSGLGATGRRMGIPEPPPPDLTTPVAITAALVVLYLICAAGIFFS